MKWPDLGKLASAGCVLLIGSWLFIKVDNKPGSIRPSAQSMNAGGTATFVRVLKQRGYPVRVSFSNLIEARSGEVPIAFSYAENLPGSYEYDDDKEGESKEQAVVRGLVSFASKGEKVVLITVPRSYSVNGGGRKQATEALPKSVAKKFSVYGDFSFGSHFDRIASIELLNLPGRSVLSELDFMKGGGRLLHWWDGSMLLNQYIDKDQNVEAFLSTLERVVPKGTPLVIVEAAWGNSYDEGILDHIGPWAVAGWKQMLVLFGVVIWTLGSPFGLARLTRVKEEGGKERILAITNLLKRSHQWKFVLRAGYEDADSKVRRKLGLPGSAPIAERNDHLPSELVACFSRLEALLKGDEYTMDDTFAELKELESKVNDFIRISR